MLVIKQVLVIVCVILELLQIGPTYHLSYSEKQYDRPVDQLYDTKELKGMIVPHHIVPMDKLNNMYATASNDAVVHILLLSPDHFTNSNRPSLTSTYNWQGSFGFLKNNKAYGHLLKNFDFVYHDPKEIKNEHGITSHIPLIKKYFKNAEITVLAVSKQIGVADLDQLIASIPQDTFVIASVDFSHYYPLKEADAFDQDTKSLMLSGNYKGFFGMSDAYFDTPGVLYTIFTWANLNAYSFEIYDQSNSAYYFDRGIQETTSYFFVGFH